jgi:hypothetical protein
MDEPCRADCPLCTELPTPAAEWDGPYQAFRWSPDAPAGVREQVAP